MALNGIKEVGVTPYNLLRFTWKVINQDTYGNYSNISWSLDLVSSSYGRIASTASKKWSVIINGNTYSGTNTVNINNNSTKNLANGTYTVFHNADGSKTFSYSFSQEFSITFSDTNIGTASGSGTGDLDTIPRAAKFISAPNFTSLENPTITYSNPAGDNVTAIQACISIVGGSGGDDIPYRDIPATGNSYTFNLTASERNTLINAVKSGNSIQVRFYIVTNLGGILYYDYTTKTFSIANAAPIIDHISAEDSAAAIVALTGNKNYWVKGISDITYSVNAFGQSGASISKYMAVCGEEVINAYTGTFFGVSSNSINITVTDTRGNVATAAITPERWIDYNGLTCTMSSAKLETDGILNFSVTGVYFSGSFGAVNNSLSLQYCYKVDGEEGYSSWFSLAPTIADSSYTASGTITGLDYKKNYVIKLQATDKVISTYTEYRIHKSDPIFDWAEDDFNFNVITYTPALVLKGTTGIYNQYSDGTAKDVMRVGTNDILYIGTGGKSDSVGGTYIGGQDVFLTANNMAFVTAPSGVYINSNPLSDFVVDQGTSGNWAYRKWNSGLCEMWGWCQPTYQAAHYMSSYQAFPVSLVSWVSAIGTLNSFTGNLATYLTTNVKVECMNYGCNVWVQNSNSSFESGGTCDVSLHIVGKWK